MKWTLESIEQTIINGIFGDFSKINTEIEETLKKYKLAKATTAKGEAERLNRVDLLQKLKNKYSLLY